MSIKNKIGAVSATLALTLLSNNSNADGRDTLHFSPEHSVNVSLKVTNQELHLSIKSDSAETTRKIVIDTEKTIHMEVNDYNFDGKNDFAIWYVSGGMGTYSIYRIFTYSKKTKDFVEISPKCGDEFINARLNVNKRQIINSYYDMNIIKTCALSFPPKREAKR